MIFFLLTSIAGVLLAMLDSAGLSLVWAGKPAHAPVGVAGFLAVFLWANKEEMKEYYPF